MFRLALTVLFTALILAAGACGGDGKRDPAVPLKVVTSIAPITSLAENIGGTKIELTGLVPEGEPRKFAPSDSAAKALREADLIILNGLGLEEATLQIAESSKKTDGVLLLLGDAAITSAEYGYDSSYPKSAGKPNPHAWVDPVITAEYAQLIHEQFVDLDEENTKYYDANFAELTKRLEHLDQQIRIAIQTIQQANRKLLTYLDFLPYWAKRYGFTLVAAAPLAEPTTGEITALIAQIEDEKAPAVFGPETLAVEVIQRITDETDAQYVTELSAHDLPGKAGDKDHSHIGLLLKNMKAIIPALGGDAAPLGRVKPGLVFSDGPSSAQYTQ